MNRKTPRWQTLGRAAFALACLGLGIGLGVLVRSLQADPYDQQRQQIAQLAPAERRALDRNFERYLQLSETQQEQLQTFHTQLQTAANAQVLQTVLTNYFDWVRNLSPTQRAELAALADQPNERLERVVEYRRELLRREPLTRDDIQRVVAWVEAVLRKNADSDDRDDSDANDRPSTGSDQRRAMLWYAAARLHDRGPGRPLTVTEQDFEELAQQLSPQAQQRLADAKTLADKRREVAGWLYLAIRRSGGFRSREAEQVSEKELVDFFENKLDDAKREELLSLPHNARIERLRFLYLRDKYPDRPFGPGLGGPRSEGGRGFDGPRFEGSRFDGPSPGGSRLNRQRGEGQRNEGQRSEPNRRRSPGADRNGRSEEAPAMDPREADQAEPSAANSGNGDQAETDSD